MSRLIKKYKNRRLYDTETSQYITLEQLHQYVLAGKEFKVEDSETGKDLTNPILLQIIVEMEGSSTQFLSSEMLRNIITLANHPMHLSFKNMTEQMLKAMNKPKEDNPYAQVSQQWGDQIKDMMSQWQKLFK